MFERYIENARRTIFFARYEAAQRGSSEIVPEHILLGLFGDGPTWASGVIRGGSAEQIRDEIFAYLPQLEKQSAPAQMFFDQQSQRVLASAEEEAEGLAHRHVSNHHILLGLLHVEDSFAAQLLRRHGLSADYLREQIPILLEEIPAPPRTNAAIPDTSPSERQLYELDRRVIELFHLNDYQGAMKLVDHAVADPTLNRTQTIQRLVPIASVIARIIGDLDLVKRYCELRLACDPEDTMARYALADCLALQGRTDEAVDTARKAYELNLGSGKVGDGLAELIEKRFPEIKLPGAPRYS